jgi:hypothetical protein
MPLGYGDRGERMELDNKYYIVELEEGVWLARFKENGLPTTSSEHKALSFVDKILAELAIKKVAQVFPARKFPDAKVVECVEI